VLSRGPAACLAVVFGTLALMPKLSIRLLRPLPLRDG
jgi:hypothetical protein